MSEREVMPALPTSGQIIGALVTKLGLRHIALPPRTARRYFSADLEQLVKESTREELIGAIAEMLADAGFAAAPQVGEDGHKSVPQLASMLRWHADHWDRLRSFLRRRTMYVLPSNLPQVWAAYVRLAVIDLALRLAAYLHLAGSSPAALDLLGSTDHTERGDYLNRKRNQAGLTLDGLAEEVEVSKNTVDAWMYHGARPTNDNLARIAEVLGDKIEGSTTSGNALELRSLYWISDVAGLLAEHIGAKAVDDAIGRLHRYAAATYHTIADQFPTEERAADLTVLANLGVGAGPANPLLAALIEHEPDDEWREDLQSTGMDWIRRVLAVNYQVYLAEVDDLMQETDGRLFEDWGVSNPEAYAHYRRAQELQMQGKPGEALVEMEQAARLDPLDPANHFSLGSVKASIGIGRSDTSLVSAGLKALWLAVTLDPKWIVPWTEIGEILLHTGPTQGSGHPSAKCKTGMRAAGLSLLQRAGGGILETGAIARGAGSIRGRPRTGPAGDGCFGRGCGNRFIARRRRQAPAVPPKSASFWCRRRHGQTPRTPPGILSKRSGRILTQPATTGRSPSWTPSSGSSPTMTMLT